MRTAVEKSGLRSCRTRLTESLKRDGSSRSMMAPLNAARRRDAFGNGRGLTLSR